jgi:MFS family permease
MILRLWHGISSSPISGTYGSYGIGAIVAAQLAKPFIKFNPLESHFNETANITGNSTSNSTKIILPEEIQLQVPYGCGVILGALVTIGLLVSQYYELKELKNVKLHQNKQQATLIVKEQKTLTKRDAPTDKVYLAGVQKIFFLNVLYKNMSVFIIFLQIFLLCIMFISVYAFLILNNFLLTFFTKGPAKLEVSVFISIYTVFWLFFISGRLLSVFIAYKMNSFVFYGTVISLSFVSVGLFVFPFFNSKILPIYFILAFIGLVNGPLQPACFMLASKIIGDVKSVVVALFCTSFNLGAMLSQVSSGYILDNFKPEPDWFLYTDATSIYILPFLLFSYVALNFTVFIISVLIFRFSEKYIKSNMEITSD